MRDEAEVDPDDAADPVLMDLLRGDHVESRHRGCVVVLDGERTALAVGDVSRPVYARSAMKPFQLAAAVRAGTFAGLDIGPAEMAVMAASHNAEPRHLECVMRLLDLGGFTVADLRCGTHPPLRAQVAEDLARSGAAPTALHNNCSGKHAGMLLFARRLGADPARYLEPGHPIQVRIRATVQEVGGGSAPFPTVAVDGCSAPTFRLPLLDLARAFQRLADAEHAPLADDCRSALASVRDAMTTEPFLVAGTERIDTDLMRAGAGRFVSKVGAEGVIAMGVRDRRLGIAIKVGDGAARAYETLLVDLLDRYGVLDDAARAALQPYLETTLRNHAGLVVGRRVVRVHP